MYSLYRPVRDGPVDLGHQTDGLFDCQDDALEHLDSIENGHRPCWSQSSFRQLLQASLNLGEVGGGETPELGGFEVNLGLDISTCLFVVRTGPSVNQTVTGRAGRGWGRAHAARG